MAVAALSERAVLQGSSAQFSSSPIYPSAVSIVVFGLCVEIFILVMKCIVSLMIGNLLAL